MELLALELAENGLHGVVVVIIFNGALVCFFQIVGIGFHTGPVEDELVFVIWKEGEENRVFNDVHPGVTAD